MWARAGCYSDPEPQWRRDGTGREACANSACRDELALDCGRHPGLERNLILAQRREGWPHKERHRLLLVGQVKISLLDDL